MKTRITYHGESYCDQGPNEGKTRLDIRASVYMTDEELARYHAGGIDVVITDPEKDVPIG